MPPKKCKHSRLAIVCSSKNNSQYGISLAQCKACSRFLIVEEKGYETLYSKAVSSELNWSKHCRTRA